MRGYRPTRAVVRQAMQSASTRAALKLKADRLASRADTLGSGEGVTIDARVTSGTRPKGRPYSQVTSSNSSQEWGDRWTERRRILGRTAEGA